jgi:thiol:disulfide interchange protein DsbC
MSRLHWIVPVVALAALTATSARAGDDDTALIERVLAERLTGVSIEHVSPSPVPGLYQAITDDGILGVLYVSPDGRYVLSGKLVDTKTREDLTERVLAKRRLAILGEVPEDRMIIYESSGETQHTVTIFTDIDCPFCRKLHREIGELNRLGIRVRYLFYPRAGIPSFSYDKAVSVWCAPDRRAEMTVAKSGTTPEQRRCANPIEEHMALARRLGLTGTPFTITETGRVVPGYRGAIALLQALEADKRGTRP